MGEQGWWLARRSRHFLAHEGSPLSLLTRMARVEDTRRHRAGLCRGFLGGSEWVDAGAFAGLSFRAVASGIVGGGEPLAPSWAPSTQMTPLISAVLTLACLCASPAKPDDAASSFPRGRSRESHRRVLSPDITEGKDHMVKQLADCYGAIKQLTGISMRARTRARAGETVATALRCADPFSRPRDRGRWVENPLIAFRA